MNTGEQQHLERLSDDLWARMEELFELRQTSGYECWADIDAEYIETERRYHATLDKLYEVQRGTG